MPQKESAAHGPKPPVEGILVRCAGVCALDARRCLAIDMDSGDLGALAESRLRKV